jgi:hypothetical protein
LDGQNQPQNIFRAHDELFNHSSHKESKMAALWEFITSPVRRLSGIGQITLQENSEITKPAVLFNNTQEAQNDENATVSNISSAETTTTIKPSINAEPSIRKPLSKATTKASSSKRPIAASKLPSNKQPLAVNMKQATNNKVKVKSEKQRSSLRKKHKVG